MITPDICTSMICRTTNKHCPECSHTIFEGELDIPGIFKRFTFPPRFGPLFVNKSGKELVRVPSEKNYVFWNAFDKWHEEKFKEKE